MSKKAIIELINVSKAFGDLIVLDKVNLKIFEGETLAVIGPSGTGKSVLIKLIVGLLKPDSGQVLIDGTDMVTASDTTKRNLRKRVGVSFQHGALFNSMSAGENIAFPLVHHTAMRQTERKERVLDLLELVDLKSVYEKPVTALSGGQQKRIAIARAIALQPEVLLFDEPNSGLDPLTSDTIDQLIQKMQMTLGITFIIITHDIVSAINIADSIAMLNKGQLIEHAPTKAFVKSTHPMVQKFLHRNLHVSLPVA